MKPNSTLLPWFHQHHQTFFKMCFYMSTKYLTIIILILPSIVFAQGTEGFSQLNASGIRYEAGTFIGDQGLIWHYSGARTVRSQYQFDEVSIGFGTQSEISRYLSVEIPEGGIGELRFVIGPYFTAGSAQDRRISVTLNDIPIHSETLSSMSSFQWVEIQNINLPSPIELRWIADGERQIILDAIHWTAYDPNTGNPNPIDPIDPIDPIEPIEPVEPAPLQFRYSLPPDPIPLSAGSQLFWVNSNYAGIPINWQGPGHEGATVWFGDYIRIMLSETQAESISIIELGGNEIITCAINWVVSPARVESDFIVLLLDSLGWWMKDVLDPRFWEIATDNNHPVHPQFIDQWINTPWYRRLEQLALAVRFHLGFDLLAGEYHQQEGPYIDFLQSADGLTLLNYLHSRPESFLGHWPDLENLSPAILWNQVWLHWSGVLPSPQQVLQMNTRFEDDYLGKYDDWNQSFLAFLWDFQNRKSAIANELVFNQLPPYFEEEVILNLLNQLIFNPIGTSNNDSGREPEDLPDRIWEMMSQYIYQLPGTGWQGSIFITNDWYWHSVYGWIYRKENSHNWHFSEYWGWFHPARNRIGQGVWFHAAGKGWYWTNETIFPWIWSEDSKAPEWCLFWDLSPTL